MKRSLLDILACPICKHHPLKLYIFEEKKEIVSGLLECVSCSRWYPIIEEVPHMLPDDLRNKREDLEFLKQWSEKTPESVLKRGKPYTLSKS